MLCLKIQNHINDTIWWKIVLTAVLFWLLLLNSECSPCMLSTTGSVLMTINAAGYTVLRFSYFRLETLLYGDDNLDYETNVAIALAVHEFIKNSERF